MKTNKLFNISQGDKNKVKKFSKPIVRSSKNGQKYCIKNYKKAREIRPRIQKAPGMLNN